MGGALRRDSYATLALQATIVGSAAAWAICWIRNKATDWRFIFEGGWLLGALLTLAVVGLRDHPQGEEAVVRIVAAVFRGGSMP